MSSLPGGKFPAAPVLLAGGPQLGSWQVAVVWVDETPAGDASGREYPRAEQNRQRPIDTSELHDGPGHTIVAVGPCETLSPSSEESQEPLEHAVLIHAAVETLSPSDCYHVGPAGPYVAGGPVGPDVSLKDPEPLEHAVLIHAAVETLSPSDCYPAGPAGPYVAGGPVGPDDCLQVLEPFEQLVLDHADPGWTACLYSGYCGIARACGC